jgi:spermidine synthase
LARHSIEVSEEAGVRYLHFGSEWVQGAMRIARPLALELDYTRDMAMGLAARALAAPVRTVLQVGLGAASVTKHIAHAYPDVKQTVLEINPQVVAVAHTSFKVPTDAPLEIVETDAVGWMHDARLSVKFDCIMVDGYDQHARFGGLGSREFYADCRRHLAKDGVLILNLFGRSRGYRAQLDALDDVFKSRVLALPPIEGGNSVVLAATGAALALDAEDIDAELARTGMSAKFRAGSLQRLRASGVKAL